MQQYPDTGRIRPVSFFVFCLLCAMGIQAAPQVTTSSTIADGVLSCAITGQSIPAIGSIRLTMAYEPQETNMAEALVSSPVPKTAIAAMVDTATRHLILTVVGAGTVTIADGTAFTLVKLPLVPGSGSTYSLRLLSATVIDQNGVSHEAQVQTGLRPRQPGSAGTTMHPGRDMNRQDYRYSVSGRRIAAPRAASAVYVHRRRLRYSPRFQPRD